MIPSTETSRKENNRASAQKQEVREIEIRHIIINPFQPRKQFNLQELEELAESIKAVGIIHPPVVKEKNEQNVYELIAGERRLRAAEIAGLQKIPVLVREGSSLFSAHAALIENVQRVDLNPIEVAQAMKQLLLEFDFTQEDLAKQLGKKRSTVANFLRLLALPKKIQESLARGEISMGHAKAILSIDWK